MAKKIDSREKGKRFERKLAGIFRDYGYDDARRTAQYCGNTGDASDVVGLPGLHIEAKHVEQMRLYDWMAQAKHDAHEGGEGRLPAVFHKKNNHAILVTVELDTFMRLYREWEVNMALEERAARVPVRCESGATVKGPSGTPTPTEGGGGDG